MAANERRKDLRDCELIIEDGFSGSADIDDASLAALDTTLNLDVDTLDLHDDATIVPVTARFTTEGIEQIRTVTAVNNNKVWTLTVDATSGNYTLTFNGVATANIAEGATAAAVQSALEALAAVAVGELVVTGSTGGPYVIEAKGQYAGSASPTLSATSVDLAGGGATVGTVVTQPGAKTWQLTFTPAFASGAVPTTGDTVTFLPCQSVARLGEGQIDWEITKEYIVDRDRGRLDGRRRGDEQPMKLDTSFVYSYLKPESADTVVTPYEALLRIGNAAGWHNAAANPCEPYAVNIVILDTPECGSDAPEKATFPYFGVTSIKGSVQDATLTVSGECMATQPVVERIEV